MRCVMRPSAGERRFRGDERVPARPGWIRSNIESEGCDWRLPEVIASFLPHPSSLVFSGFPNAMAVE